MNKPILVHVHIYYPDKWDELRRCIKNIDTDYDLFVTTPKDDKNLFAKILKFNKSAKFEVLENRGFDIGPFVHVINSVDLDKYEYVVKLHTKRDCAKDMYLFDNYVGDSLWRKYLLSFISTKKNYSKSFKLIKKESIGMVTDIRLILKKKGTDKIAEKLMIEFLRKNKFKDMKYYFVAGTMFLANAEVFKPMQNLMKLEDFPISKPDEVQLAHAIERFFGYLVYLNGKKITYHTPFPIVVKVKTSTTIRKIIRFFFQYKKTKSNMRIIKICKIPVYYKKSLDKSQ